MPRVAAFARARVLQWLELETVEWDADRCAVLEEQFLVRRDEVGKASALPQVTVQPQTTVHGVDHSVTPIAELAENRTSGSGFHARPSTTDRQRLPARWPARSVLPT